MASRIRRLIRARSPNYPAISLPEAIERASNCHKAIGRSRVDRPDLAKALGFGSVNGSALSVISAMHKYGLVQVIVRKEGPAFAISDRAIAVLQRENDRERAQAIWDAASSPAIFVELMDIFLGIIPDESDLTKQLLKRGFSDMAQKSVSSSFRETFSLVLAEAHGYTPPITNAAGKSPVKRIAAVAHLPLEIAPQLETDKMRVTVTETGVEINAALTTGEGIDRLIRTLEATRPLVASRTGSSKEEPGRGQPRLGIDNLKSAEAVDAARKAGGT
jgi:hypothetical protein